MASIRRGSQVPTYSTVRKWHHTDGPYVVDMFESYGVQFYDSQRLEMDAYMARDADGSYAAITLCISKPRQNGKSFAARYYALWMAAVEGKKVLFSAHNGDTAREMFKQLREFIKANADFMAVLKPNRQGFYGAKGSEGIYFVDDDGNEGGCIEFQTRTTSGARGRTYDIIIVDEAQELTEEHLAAIKPTTFAAAPVDEQGSGPQMIYLGTPPNEKCPGTVFRDYHDRAHGDPGCAIWWMEWAVKEIPDMADRDAVMELVYQTNPAMGYRIKESTMRDAMDTMAPDNFAREALGWWTPIRTNTLLVIGRDAWDRCLIPRDRAPYDGTFTLGVRFDRDGRHGVISACIAPPAGDTPYVEVVMNQPVTHGVAPFLKFLVAKLGAADAIIIDGKGVAEQLYTRIIRYIEDMCDGDVPTQVYQTNTASAIAAYASFANAATSQPPEVSHCGQQVASEAAYGCIRRTIGKADSGGYGYASDGDADAAVLESMALAYDFAVTLSRIYDADTQEARYA